MSETLWRAAAELPDHPLAAIDGAAVGEGVSLAVEIGPPSLAGVARFRAFLASDDLGRTAEPVLRGLQYSGPRPTQQWVEVIDFNARIPLGDGRHVDVPEGIDLRIHARLAELVPAGGRLMVEYESEARSVTARALAAGVPPVATPLGGIMFAAGCGTAFRDHYAAGGGRQGRRKLQGFRAIDDEHEQRRGLEMLAELERFMNRSKQLDWLVQSQTRPIAEAAITTLRSRLGVPEGPSPAG